ncbi:unnamed protein product [Sphagnum troendelagicum]|uniref:Uncharacterized protein n=1 Tax=Sphagnum troendelagicum TaxID=128251 RepID=A0ABP0TC36_9BRYO
MPVSATTLALEKLCYVSDSQEEVLNLCEGWEHRASKRCTLDETPSQPFLNFSHVVPTEMPGALLKSDSEDSDDTECNIGFTQDPVEWASPPSPLALEEEVHDGDDRVNSDDSYVAAFESDRSQSPTHSCQTSHQKVLHMQASANFSSMQPLTQLPMETHTQTQTCSDGTPPLEPLVPIAEISVQLSPGTTAQAIQSPPVVVSEELPAVVLTKDLAAVTRVGISEGTILAPVSQVPHDERGVIQPTLRHEVVGMIQEINLQMGFEHLRWLTQEPGSGVDKQSEQHEESCPHNQLVGAETVMIENLRNGTDVAASTGIADYELADTSVRGDQSCWINCLGEEIDMEEIGPSFKRKPSALDISGQGKAQRIIEASHTPVQRFPKTVMDVVRMHSSPVTDAVGEETCGILSVAMRAGISFPPVLHKKLL